jgi:hypothetical protein
VCVLTGVCVIGVCVCEVAVEDGALVDHVGVAAMLHSACGGRKVCTKPSFEGFSGGGGAGSDGPYAC